MASVGGYACDTLCARLGPRLGCRIPAITGLIGAGIFLYAGLYASSPYTAVVLLSLCFASTQHLASHVGWVTALSTGSSKHCGRLTQRQ